MLTNAELAVAAAAADVWPRGCGMAVGLRDGVQIVVSDKVVATDQL